MTNTNRARRHAQIVKAYYDALAGREEVEFAEKWGFETFRVPIEEWVEANEQIQDWAKKVPAEAEADDFSWLDGEGSYKKPEANDAKRRDEDDARRRKRFDKIIAAYYKALDAWGGDTDINFLYGIVSHAMEPSVTHDEFVDVMVSAASYARVRAKLFALWTDRQRKAGRPEHELTQGAFTDEMNHPLRMSLYPRPNRLM